MIYLHRASFDTQSSPYTPLNYDYMGSAEFETGGVAKVFETLECNALYHEDTLHWKRDNVECNLYLLGSFQDAVNKTKQNLVEYMAGTQRSKEYIRFGPGGNYIDHQVGVDIDNHVIVSTCPNFIRFLRLVLCRQGIKQREVTNENYRLGDLVSFYDVVSNTFKTNWVVKGIPEDDTVVTLSDGKRAKKRVTVNCVVRNPDESPQMRNPLP